MLTLSDGRNELWQWDTGRTFVVGADCTQVHFSNKVFGRSIDVDVVDGIAVVPDILLQTDKDLTAWAFVGTTENGYTKISKTFKVNKRNKPADYVFTPPEQTTLEEIKEKLDYLESIQDPDAIKNAVDEYLQRNPVDFPVDSVNGKNGNVKLTADDVGAISQDKLQDATNVALAQAKESGEFDGKDGYTPRKGVDYFDGKDGKDGYTPVKGVDYWTPDDKQEIVNEFGAVSYNEQTLTEEQKAQARANIGAVAENGTEPVKPVSEVVLTAADFEKGKYGAGGKLDDNTVVRTKEPIRVTKGDRLCVDCGENDLNYYASFYPELNGEPNWEAWTMAAGWEKNFQIMPSVDGYYVVQFINNGRTSSVSAEDFDGHVVLYRDMDSDMDLRETQFAQISDPFTMTSASGVRAAYDSTCGLIGCVYMGAWLKYGEQHDKTVLTIFSVANPNERKHVTVSESWVYEVNIISLGDRVWRVMMCKGANGWFYRDYDLNTDTLTDEQEMYAVIGGSDVSMSVQNRESYAGNVHNESHNATQLTSSLFKDTDGKYYGCWCAQAGNPVIFYSTDNMKTIVPFAVFPRWGSYEASVIKKDGILRLIQRGGYNIGVSVDDGKNWTAKGRRGDDNRPSVYLVNGNVVWLYGLRDRNQVAISFGDDFFNPEKTIVFESPWGCVYADMLIINNSLYLLYSDSQLAMDVTNGANNNRKDCIKFVRLMDNVFE